MACGLALLDAQSSATAATILKITGNVRAPLKKAP
jgi:hypothetical protein